MPPWFEGGRAPPWCGNEEERRCGWREREEWLVCVRERSERERGVGRAEGGVAGV